MLTIGCHLSTSKGFEAMGRTALSIGADTFAFFTRNPRGGTVRELDPDDVAALRGILDEHAFGPLVAHAPYTYNPCSAKERAREFALEAMAEDLERMEALPGNLYNFHPGAHVGQGPDAGIEMIVDVLTRVMFEGQRTTVLLETMAGKGTEVGRSFEELAAIIDGVARTAPALADNLGVCLDTCHVSDAGYDLIGDLDGVLAEFDRLRDTERMRAEAAEVLRRDLAGTCVETFAAAMEGPVQPLLRFPVLAPDTAAADRLIREVCAAGYYTTAWYRPELFPGVLDPGAYRVPTDRSGLSTSDDITARVAPLPTDHTPTEMAEIARIARAVCSGER